MSCRCHTNKTSSEAPALQNGSSSPLKSPDKPVSSELPLPRCFLCAMKHLMRAKILFEEYYTGYPSYIKLMMNTLAVAEGKVRSAFLLYQQVQAHLDMSASELIGHTDPLSDEIIQVANEIRDARIRLNTAPLFVPNFDTLCIRLQTLKIKTEALPETADTPASTGAPNLEQH